MEIVQRRSGRTSSDVQILKIDEDLESRTEKYMKVIMIHTFHFPAVRRVVG